MNDPGLSPAAVEEARLELSMAAGASERANRPRLPLFGAVALLVIATIYTLSQAATLRSSMASVAKAQKNAADAVKLVNQVKGLQDTLARRGLDPNPNIAAKLEGLARDSGLTLTGAVTDTPGGTGQAGMSQHRYTARFSDQDPTLLMQFLNATQESPETAGVEIARINLLPGAPDPATGKVRWNLDVEFTRWERASKR